MLNDGLKMTTKTRRVSSRRFISSYYFPAPPFLFCARASVCLCVCVCVCTGTLCTLSLCVCVCAQDVTNKPWLQQKPAPWNNPNNNHDNFKFGRRILDNRPGENGPMTKDAKAAMRDELRGQMEAQIQEKKMAKEAYADGGMGAPPAGQPLRPSKTRPW